MGVGCYFPPSGDLLDPGIGPTSPVACALQADSLLLSHWGNPIVAWGTDWKNSHRLPRAFLCIRLSLPQIHGPGSQVQWEVEALRKCLFLSCFVTKAMPNSLRPRGLQPARLLSMGFLRQKYWRGLPFPSPGDLLNPRIEPVSPMLQVVSWSEGKFFTAELPEIGLWYITK